MLGDAHPERTYILKAGVVQSGFTLTGGIGYNNGYITATSGTCIAICTGPFDFNKINTIGMEVLAPNGNHTTWIGASPNIANAPGYTKAYNQSSICDVSSLSGNLYILIDVTSTFTKVFDIWFT